MKTNSFINSLFRSLPVQFHPTFWLMLALLLLQSILELVSLGSIVPVTYSLTDPEKFFTQGYGSRLSQLWPSLSYFQLGIVILAGMLFVFFLKNVISQAITNFQSRFVYQIFQTLSVRLHHHYLNATFTEIHARPSSDIVRDIVGVPQRFATNVVLATLLLLTEFFAILFISIGIFCYEPRAFLCTVLVFLPPLALFYLWIRRRIQTIDSGINELESRVSMNVYESIDGYLDILATGSKQYFLERYRSLAAQFSSLLSARTILGSIPARLAEGSMILGVISLFLYSKVRHQDLSSMTTILGIYLLGAYRLLPSANRITLCLISIRGNLFSMDTAQMVATTPEPPPRNYDAKHETLSFQNHIKLSDLTYRFPNAAQDVLHGINLTIQKGECLGIAGPSGAGKSTLLHIILGALTPTQGSIHVDHERLTERTLPIWRRAVGYVQQNVFLLSGSLKDNITFGSTTTDSTLEQIQRSIRMASLTDVVEHLPSKWDTGIGDGGLQLSFGQRQRVGIARAIFHGARVIIFDEPTSALDPKTEQDIKDSILQLKKECFTIILVSHKPTSLSICDRVFTMENGNLSIHEGFRS